MEPAEIQKLLDTPAFYRQFSQPLFEIGRMFNVPDFTTIPHNSNIEKALYEDFSKIELDAGRTPPAYDEWLEGLLKTRCLTNVEPDTTGVQQARSESGAG